jgi:Na+-driven multidrug efflux pump
LGAAINSPIGHRPSHLEQLMTPATKPLWQRFLVFLLPLMLSNILQSVSGTINSIYLGNMIGVDALAAASIFGPILFLMIGFVVGIASGAAILIGQAFGARNMLKIKEVVGTSLTVTCFAGIAIAVLGWFFSRSIMELLGAPPNIIDAAAGYGQAMLLGMPFFFVFLVLTSMLRGVGDTQTPLFALILSIAVGVVLTPALIQGWFGLPQIGVLSAAVSFNVGTVLTLVFLYFYLGWKKSPMALDSAQRHHLKVDWG